MHKPSPVQIAFLRQYGALFPSKDFAYVTIHPLADEAEILRRLKMAPQECSACDLYWALGQGIAFVSVHACEQTVFVASKSILSNPPGERIWTNPRVSVYVDPDDPIVRYHFGVTTRRSPITIATVETVLAWLEHWFYANPREEEKLLGRQTISDVDIVP